MRFKRYEIARCTICNKVSHEEVSSDFGEQVFGSFYEDEGGTLCFECRSEIDDVMSDWYIEDELKEKEK